MSGARISLERFDDALPNGAEESADYKRGLTDGQVRASKTQAAALETAISEIASTLKDMSFGYEEARLHVLETLHPLLSQLSETVLPMVIQETFGAHLVEVVETQFQASLAAPIQIAIAPDLVATIAETHSNEHFEFVPNPKLSFGQALIRHDDTHTLLDLFDLQTALQSALSGLERPERTHSNG